jgi:putative membrane protein
MVDDHKDDIREFQREATQGQDPDVKAFAIGTLPTLKKHLSMIQSIAAAQGLSE